MKKNGRPALAAQGGTSRQTGPRNGRGQKKIWGLWEKKKESEGKDKNCGKKGGGRDKIRNQVEKWREVRKEMPTGLGATDL